MTTRLGLSLLVTLAVAGVLGAQKASSGADFITEDPPITVIQISKPFKVRTVRGVVAVEGANQPLPGAIFQLRDRPGHVRFAATNEKGEFTLPAVVPGTYDFKVTKDEFHSIVGKVIVSRWRFGKGSIRVSLSLGT